MAGPGEQDCESPSGLKPPLFADTRSCGEASLTSRDSVSSTPTQIAATAMRNDRSMREGPMYAAIRQAKAKAGMADELAGRIKKGAISIISNVPGFMGYYVVYSPDDTGT